MYYYCSPKVLYLTIKAGFWTLLLLEQMVTVVVFGDTQMVEHPVGFPPPVMLGLSELSLSVVTMDIGPMGICAG